MLDSIISRKQKPKMEKLHSPNVYDRPDFVPYQKQIEEDIEKQVAFLEQSKRRIVAIQTTLILADMLLVNLGFLISFLIRYGLSIPEQSFLPYKSSFVFLTLIYVSGLAFFRVYKSRFSSSWELFKRVLSGLFLGTLLSVAFVYVFRVKWGAFPTSVFAISFFINLLLIFKVNQFVLKAKKRIKKRVIILGEGKVDDIVGKKANIERRKINEIEELIKCKDIDEIVICEKIQDVNFLICLLQNLKVSVVFSPSVYQELLPERINGENSNHPLLSTFVGRKSDEQEFLIRSLDIIGSLIILILTTPLLLLSSILIKILSPGSIFYTQDRAGKDAKIFKLYKLRTMVENAEKVSGLAPATEDDTRITGIGRFLRRTRLDELPQLANVLKGEMSLVGPRPENLHRVETHKTLQGIRLAVKPGLTGLAQIRSFYDLKPQHKIKYDYLYIQRRSLWLNIYILLQTIPVVLSRKGW